MTCTICCNVHDGECSVAALKARVAGVARERDILAAALAKEQDRRTHIARIVAYREATGAGLKEAKEACEATGNEADAREPATLAAQIAWAEERCDAARKLAAAKATDVGRLTALLAAETERALKMEGERDEARAQLAEALHVIANERGETVPGDAVTEGWEFRCATGSVHDHARSWASGSATVRPSLARISGGPWWWGVALAGDWNVDPQGFALTARDAIKAATAVGKG